MDPGPPAASCLLLPWELESALLDRILDHISENNTIISVMPPGLVPFSVPFIFDLFFGWNSVSLG